MKISRAIFVGFLVFLHNVGATPIAPSNVGVLNPREDACPSPDDPTFHPKTTWCPWPQWSSFGTPGYDISGFDPVYNAPPPDGGGWQGIDLSLMQWDGIDLGKNGRAGNQGQKEKREGLELQPRLSAPNRIDLIQSPYVAARQCVWYLLVNRDNFAYDTSSFSLAAGMGALISFAFNMPVKHIKLYELAGGKLHERVLDVPGDGAWRGQVPVHNVYDDQDMTFHWQFVWADDVDGNHQVNGDINVWAQPIALFGA